MPGGSCEGPGAPGDCASGPCFGSGTLRRTNVDGATPPAVGSDGSCLALVRGMVRGSPDGRPGVAGAMDSAAAIGSTADNRMVLGSRLVREARSPCEESPPCACAYGTSEATTGSARGVASDAERPAAACPGAGTPVEAEAAPATLGACRTSGSWRTSSTASGAATATGPSACSATADSGTARRIWVDLSRRSVGEISGRAAAIAVSDSCPPANRGATAFPACGSAIASPTSQGSPTRTGSPANWLAPSTHTRNGTTYPMRSSCTLACTGCPAARAIR